MVRDLANISYFFCLQRNIRDEVDSLDDYENLNVKMEFY